MAIYLFFTFCSWSTKHVYSLILLCVDVSIFLLLVTRRDERHEVTGCLIAWKFFAGGCISWAKLYPLLGSSLKVLYWKCNTHILLYFFHNGKFLVYWGRWIVGKDKGEVNDGYSYKYEQFSKQCFRTEVLERAKPWEEGGGVPEANNDDFVILTGALITISEL